MATGIHSITIHKGSDTVAAHSALLKLGSTCGFCYRSDTFRHEGVTFLLHLYSVSSESSPIFAAFSRNILGVFYNLFLFSFLPFFFSFSSSPSRPFPFSSFSLSLSPCFFHFILVSSSTHEYLFSPLHNFSLHACIVCLWPECPSSSDKSECSFQLLHSLSRSKKELRGSGLPVKP